MTKHKRQERKKEYYAVFNINELETFIKKAKESGSVKNNKEKASTVILKFKECLKYAGQLCEKRHWVD